MESKSRNKGGRQISRVSMSNSKREQELERVGETRIETQSKQAGAKVEQEQE
jgi:hypothetical protein